VVSRHAEQEARELARRSQLEYDLDHAEAALRDIERAYLLDPLPALLFNLGQCHRKLGHWEPAETAYRNYLRYRPDASNRKLVLELLDQVHRERVRAQQAAAVRAAPAPLRASIAPPPPSAVPPRAWAEESPRPPRSHGLAWALVGVGAAAAIVATIGAVEVESYDSASATVATGELESRPGTTTYSALAGQESSAIAWRAVGFVALGAAIACVPAVIFSW
jgi:tetratricopeptide (TPR) repeat protein